MVTFSELPDDEPVIEKDSVLLDSKLRQVEEIQEWVKFSKIGKMKL